MLLKKLSRCSVQDGIVFKNQIDLEKVPFSSSKTEK
jgi:hypothetical protein